MFSDRNCTLNVCLFVFSFSFNSYQPKILITDPILIQRFIHSVYGNFEKTKKLIENSFTMRNNGAHIFLKRDPLSIEAKKISEVT